MFIDETAVNVLMTIFTLFFVVVGIAVLLFLAGPSDRKSVEYFAQVHKNNQDKIKRDETAAFLATLDMPVPYKSIRPKGEKDGEGEIA